MVRTRFAPSPTGFLHIGGARTALFAWAYARHHGGTFILRIEDTDLERSTPAATQAILDGMRWLRLDADEGPYYQTQRMDRYREVIAQMLEDGSAYRCWCTKEELDAMRAAQEARGLKPRYDGRWRPEPGRALPEPPAGVDPVVRFRNPPDGATSWNDIVKGPISFDNAELDDLIIARSDGTPTYNFCVVVDDRDMRITHVLRGDDHVNNTPRQINILRALGAPVPEYGHLPMIHGPDGQKLSKRHGAVSVMQYDEDGYLPDAVVNYLARLGWSHGDEEIFSREQLVQWFDGSHISRSPSRFDFDKLRWLNGPARTSAPRGGRRFGYGRRGRPRCRVRAVEGACANARRARGAGAHVLCGTLDRRRRPRAPPRCGAARVAGRARQPRVEAGIDRLDCRGDLRRVEDHARRARPEAAPARGAGSAARLRRRADAVGRRDARGHAPIHCREAASPRLKG